MKANASPMSKHVPALKKTGSKTLDDHLELDRDALIECMDLLWNHPSIRMKAAMQLRKLAAEKTNDRYFDPTVMFEKPPEKIKDLPYEFVEAYIQDTYNLKDITMAKI